MCARSSFVPYDGQDGLKQGARDGLRCYETRRIRRGQAFKMLPVCASSCKAQYCKLDSLTPGEVATTYAEPPLATSGIVRL